MHPHHFVKISSQYIGPQRKSVVLLFHNESTFHSNEDQGWMWAEKGKQPIRPKGLGRGIMVSDFVDEFNGLLTLTEEEFERGRLMYPNLKKKARVLLKSMPDFKYEKTKVETLLIDNGYKAYFIPKFHCELNPIERVWAQSKKYSRANCVNVYSFKGLEEIVEPALESVSLDSIRKFFRFENVSYIFDTIKNHYFFTVESFIPLIALYSRKITSISIYSPNGDKLKNLNL